MTDKKQFAGIISFFGLALFIILYFLVHRPFQTAQVVLIASAVWQILLMAVILTICGGIGRVLIPDLDDHPLVIAAVQLMLGTGVVSIVVLALGALWHFDRTIAWALALLLTAIFHRQVWAWCQTSWQGIKTIRPTGKLPKTIAWLSGLIVLSQLLVALAPPLKFDALVYHLTLPQEYLRLGRITTLPGNVFSGFPQTVHMQYLWSLGLGSSRAAALAWGYGLFALSGVWGYVMQRFNQRYAWVSTASLLCGFSLASALSWGYVDWPCLLAGISFLATLDAWRQLQERRWLVLAGLIGGFAISIKYTNAILPLAGGLYLLWQQRKNARQLIQSGVLYALMVVIPMLPWLLKNWLATGNPFYPLLFPSGAMDAVRLDMYQHNVIGGSWVDLVFLPLRATLWGLEGAVVGNAPRYTTSIGPLLVGLAALAWLAWKKANPQQKHAFSLAGWVTLAGWLVWAINTRLVWHLAQARLYYSVFPATAVLAAVGFYGLERRKIPGLRLGRLTATLVVLVLGLNTLQISLDMVRKGTLQVLSGAIDDQTYLEDNLGVYALVMKSMEELPTSSKVLMLWETRSLYCPVSCEPDETIDRWISDLHRLGRVPAVLLSWREEGYTQLLYYQAGADFTRQTDWRYSEADWQMLDELLSQLTLVEDYNQSYRLYRISP